MHPDDPIDGEDAEIVELPFARHSDDDEADPGDGAGIRLPVDPELQAVVDEVTAALGGEFIDGDESIAEGDEGVPSSADDPAEVEAYTHDDYRNATTEAYEGLADLVREADESGPVEQSMTVRIPGLDGGIVGFEDIVEGELGIGEEESPLEQEFDAEIRAEIEAQRQRRTNLQQRIATGLGLIGIVGAAVYFGPIWFVLFVAVIAFLGTGEFFASARRSGYNPVSGIGLLASVGVFVGAWTIGAAGIAATAILTLIVLTLFYVLNERRDPLTNLGVTALGFLWVASSLAFIVPLTRMDGWQQIVGLVVLSVAGHDVGAFFIGRTFGSHKLAPHLSPNKTIEGLIGGVALGAGIAIALAFVPWFSDVVDLKLALITAVVTSVFAPLGDVAESLVKRSLETKDMGTILPGHGGVLDRLDSFAFVLPTIFVVFTFLGLLP